MERRHPVKRSEYLENVSGYKIVTRQQEINENPLSWTTASITWLKEGKMVKTKDDKIHQAYDAFIFWEERPLDEGSSESKPATDAIQEDTMDIVIPE